MGVKETDEELALFLEVRRRDNEKEKDNLLFFNNTDDIDVSLEQNNGNRSDCEVLLSAPQKKTCVDDFLNSENEKADYDWLLTPPGTPLFPSLENESRKTILSQIGSDVRPTALKTRLANVQIDPTSKNNLVTKHTTPTLPSNIDSMNVNCKPSISIARPSSTSRAASSTRPSSTGRPASITRPSSTGRPASIARPSSTGRPASIRPATPTGRPTLPGTAKTSRSSTPTSRPTLPSMKSTAPRVRSSTPTRTTARSSTPTARPTFPTSKSTSRAATPSRQPAARSSSSTMSVPQTRSSSVKKSDSTMPKKTAQSRGNSPTVGARPWKPSELPGVSLDTPPNLRTSFPQRPLSASRVRPGGPNVLTSSVDAGSSGRTRQQSCSPSRGRISNASASKRSSMPMKSKAHCSDSDDVNPVLMGTQMVERVVNMRKLGPPKGEDNSTGKSTNSVDSLGFGRTLSKKSLDMALRHMDIRRSMSGTGLKPLMKSIPASSMYSVRSGSTRSRDGSMPDSPLATCSNASSEPSVNNISNYFSETEDNKCPTSQHVLGE